MSRKTKILGVLAVVAAMMASVQAVAAWQAVSSEPGKRVEIDRDSIVVGTNGEVRARGRIVLDKAIVDPRTSSSFRVIEFSNRFDCNERTYATLKRAYYKENGDLLRQEDVRLPDSMPVRSGTPDDRLFRDACRSDSAAGGRPQSASQAVEKVNEAAAELRQLNQTILEKEVKKSKLGLSDRSGAPSGAHSAVSTKGGKSSAGGATPWSYEGAGAPDHWGALRPEYGTCASGRRQSPIDIREGIAVDLEPIQFSYPPVPFKVIDGGRNLLVISYGGSLSLLGKTYALTQVLFHRPAEMTVAGRSFDMDVQLIHRADDGHMAVVSVLLARGAENPVIQSILNNLPLERGGEVAPPLQRLDVERLLPANRYYYAFMGSLTMPPCTEDVLWLVLKETQTISVEQLDIFKRLYPPNARPVQPAFARIIKESR